MTSADLPVDTIASQWATRIDPLLGDKALTTDVSAARFANPAAFHVNNTAHAVVAYALSGEGEQEAFAEISDLARLFALRRTSPSEALSCFLDLRGMVESHTANTFSSVQLAEAQQRIETCLLYAFDAFVESREKIAEIALRELRQRNEMLEKMQESSYERTGEV